MLFGPGGGTLDPFANRPVPVAPKPKGKSGAVALAEPDDDLDDPFPPPVLPLPYTWLAGGPFWLAGLWAFSAEWRFIRQSRRDAGRPTPQDAGSTRVIVWAGLIALVGAFSAAGEWRAAAMAAPQALPYTAGIASLVAGGLLRRHCFAMLGPRFTYMSGPRPIRRSSNAAHISTCAIRLTRPGCCCMEASAWRLGTGQAWPSPSFPCARYAIGSPWRNARSSRRSARRTPTT